MYKANLNEIKSCVDERPSRFEDVDQIITLKEKLLKKQQLPRLVKMEWILALKPNCRWSELTIHTMFSICNINPTKILEIKFLLFC